MSTLPANAIPCPHCRGTGSCKEAIKRTDANCTQVWMECATCGAGVPWPHIGKQRYNSPVCTVCGGKGFNRV
jgi:hypothetical protein